MTLTQLINRGDIVQVINGRLIINAKSGKPIPDDWYNDNSTRLIIEIAEHSGIDIFQYHSFKAGKFSKGSYSGVQLQFENITDFTLAFCVFNAETTYKRGAKKGKALPKNHFRVGKQSKFLAFWKRTRLDVPDRYSNFYKYMGNLKRLYFIANLKDGEQIDKDSIMPLTLKYSEICTNLGIQSRHNLGTTEAQNRHKIGTSNRHKETHEKQVNSGIQPESATVTKNHGISNKVHGLRDKITSINKDIYTQSHDDWFADYDSYERPKTGTR